ncbi:MAG: MarC family NAAT transporter [Bacteroidetes bacterium]|nr:MAG: MarC family NAAT transporter [Bacteroidota bacterium]
MELILLAFGALFSIINPLGTIPVFVGLTKEQDLKERSRVAFWTSFNVLVIIFLSFYAGQFILSFFGISLNALKVAGGLIMSSSGFALLTGKFREHKGMKKKGVQKDIESRSDIALTPLALPMLAGPGTISLLITYNQEYVEWKERIFLLLAFLLIGLAIYVILKSSHYIVRIMGESGIHALSRIIGFIVIAIGIEMISGALFNWIEQYV